MTAEFGHAAIGKSEEVSPFPEALVLGYSVQPAARSSGVMGAESGVSSGDVREVGLEPIIVGPLLRSERGESDEQSSYGENWPWTAHGPIVPEAASGWEPMFADW